jgi:hypothetical protein
MKSAPKTAAFSMLKREAPVMIMPLSGSEKASSD